jgi:hypothetical protein
MRKQERVYLPVFTTDIDYEDVYNCELNGDEGKSLDEESSLTFIR